MSFLAKTITRELKSIPFDQCNRLYNDAADLAEATLEAENRQKYEQYIQRLEQEWSDLHEAPYEGNFSDEVPYQPHPDLAKVRRRAGFEAIAEEFIPRYKLDTIAQTWVMPQIISYISRKPVILAEVLEPSQEDVDNTEATANTPATVKGKISGIKMLDHIFDRNSEWDLGLYRFLMMDQRSKYLQTQYKGEGKQFCSLVPLILYAFKLNHGIKYMQWSRRTLSYVVNDALCQAMLCEVPKDLTREEILEAREQGLIYKSGSKAGTSRNPETTYKLYDTKGTRLHGLPELAKTMLAQIWCAHPKNRTKYMVLDPTNWDYIPAPLISEDIFKTQESYVPSTKPSVKKLPWD